MRCDLKPAAMGNTAVTGIYLNAFMKRTGQHSVCVCVRRAFLAVIRKQQFFISNLKVSYVCLI